MADQKISELTALTGANVADDDAIAIVDTSATETKKIVFSELKNALDTATGFVRITGDTMTGNLSMGDNVKAIFGAGSDLQIYHDGTRSYVDDTGAGSLWLRGGDVAIKSTASETMADFANNGAVQLYYDNAVKLATTTTGVDITGTVTANGFQADTSNTNYNLIARNSSNVAAYIQNGGSGPVLEARSGNMSAGQGDLHLKIENNGDISFYEDTGSTPKFFWDASTERLGIGTASPNTTLDITTASNTNGFLLNVIGTAPNYMFDVRDDGASKFRIDSSGVDINNSGQSQSLLSVGGGSTNAALRLRGSTGSAYAWQISSNAYLASALEFTKSTAVGGTTFSTPLMILDNSGNLLVGKTTIATGTAGIALRSNGEVRGTADGDYAARFSRLSSDGAIVGFEKDGSTSGVIGTYGGSLYMGEDDTGLAFYQGVNAVVPFHPTAVAENDNFVDLGRPAGRFKDLHLSGSIEIENGSGNVGVGKEALNSNTASNNTAFGYRAAYTNSSGSANTALGMQALYTNSSGANNTSVGLNSMYSNVSGSNNTAIGRDALQSNTASRNTAVGYRAGYSNTTASFNTFLGYHAGYENQTGDDCTYIGYRAGEDTTGEDNTFIGASAGTLITTGTNNTILGKFNGNQGGLDIRESDNNIVLADGDGNPRVYVNANGSIQCFMNATADPTIRAKNTNGSYGSTGVMSDITRTSSGGNYYHFSGYDRQAGAYKFQVHDDGDVVNTNNSYGAISDVKLKENIVDSGSQWNDIKALTVRKYSMKSDNLDAPNMLGVIAQEVEAAGMSGLVRETIDRDGEGNLLETSTKQVNYSILYMKAVKALQEAMDRIETLEAKVTALENA